MGVDARMFVKVSPPLTERQVKRLAYELGGAFGAKKFWIDRKERRAISIVEVFKQDGPDVMPKPGEQLLDLHVWSRYYGVDYERGDFPFLVTLAEWLERRLPLEAGVTKAEVWYGGDSSGICAKPFGPKERSALFAHFVESGHRPYQGGWDAIGGGRITRHCHFCDEPMLRYAWGGAGRGEVAAFTCSGCGFREETRDGGATWNEKKGDDLL